MKNKNIYLIIMLSVTAVFLGKFFLGQPLQKEKNTDRHPTNVKKARQYIDIDIDYEKLPARNEIRLIGKIKADHLKSEVLDYEWKLKKDNLKIKSGSVTGKINLSSTDEVTLDVIIKDMNKKISVKLEAYVYTENIKIGGIKSFTYDPAKETELEVQRLEAKNQKINFEALSKEERVKELINSKRKPSYQE